MGACHQPADEGAQRSASTSLMRVMNAECRILNCAQTEDATRNCDANVARYANRIGSLQSSISIYYQIAHRAHNGQRAREPFALSDCYISVSRRAQFIIVMGQFGNKHSLATAPTATHRARIYAAYRPWTSRPTTAPRSDVHELIESISTISLANEQVTRPAQITESDIDE